MVSIESAALLRLVRYAWPCTAADVNAHASTPCTQFMRHHTTQCLCWTRLALQGLAKGGNTLDCKIVLKFGNVVAWTVFREIPAPLIPSME